MMDLKRAVWTTLMLATPLVFAQSPQTPALVEAAKKKDKAKMGGVTFEGNAPPAPLNSAWNCKNRSLEGSGLGQSCGLIVWTKGLSPSIGRVIPAPAENTSDFKGCHAWCSTAKLTVHQDFPEQEYACSLNQGYLFCEVAPALEVEEPIKENRVYKCTTDCGEPSAPSNW